MARYIQLHNWEYASPIFHISPFNLSENTLSQITPVKKMTCKAYLMRHNYADNLISSRPLSRETEESRMSEKIEKERLKGKGRKTDLRQKFLRGHSSERNTKRTERGGGGGNRKRDATRRVTTQRARGRVGRRYWSAVSWSWRHAPCRW